MTIAPITTDLIIPRPSLVIPHFDELPDDVQEAVEQLSKPFPIEEVKVRPGAVRRDGSAALALAYSDWWTGYLPRLNDLVGPNNWQIDLVPWGENQILARLHAFGGLIKGTSSGSAKGEANGAQEAEVQAKKRVVAEKLLLGLFFYFLPKVWGKGERAGKDFSFADGEEQRCVYDMYVRAGLLARSTPGISFPDRSRATRPDTTSDASAHLAPPASAAPSAASSTEPRFTPPADKAARARAALVQAERATGLGDRPTRDNDSRREPTPPAHRASDPQLGLIVRLINALLDADVEHADAINAIGDALGLSHLAALRRKEALRGSAPRLTKQEAARLIDQLKTLDRTARAA
jgi:hypothetical protein